jgi:hypothetical protein
VSAVATIVYKVGDTVLDSGIYRVIHSVEHTGTFAFTIHAGKAFPSCDVCGEHVGYVLIRNAPAIETDEDFKPKQ